MKSKKTKLLLKKTTYLKFVLCFFLIYSFKGFSQDGIFIAKNISEEKEILFQQLFFKALSEKAIGNYQNAIQNLESCNEILTENVAVYFEFSKNYLFLNNTMLAKEYINRALHKEPKNIWMLQHLVKTCTKEEKYSEAIETALKIVAINPKEREQLVVLYLKNNNLNKADSLLNLVDEETILSDKLKRVKSSLKAKNEATLLHKTPKSALPLKEQFINNKSYSILKELLENSKNNITELIKYAEEGIGLFPAQPYVYLMKGKGLNAQKKFKKALQILQIGIDFAIEENTEASFYEEMAIAYKGLGKLKEEKRYIEKSKKLKS